MSSNHMTANQVYGDYLPNYYREFQNLRSEDESSMRLQFPKLPKLPELSEMTDRNAFKTGDSASENQTKSSSLNIDKGFSLSILPQSKVKVMSQTSRKNIFEDNSSTLTPGMPNISSVEINASDYIKSPPRSPEANIESQPTKQKVKPKVTVFSAEDGSQVSSKSVKKKVQQPTLNINSLNSIHIDLRPKSSKSQVPAFTAMTDSSNNSQDDDSRGQKTQAYRFKGDNRSSEDSLANSANSKWNVSVQYASKKESQREDGSKVTPKHTRPDITTNTAKHSVQGIVENRKETSSQVNKSPLKHKQTAFLADTPDTIANPYALNEFAEPDKTLAESIELPDSERHRIEMNTRSDRIDEKYRPKLERIKEEESLTASKFKSVQGSHLGDDSQVKPLRSSTMKNTSKFQVTDVDMPESPAKSTGNRTNFNNSSVSDTKSPKNPEGKSMVVMASPLSSSR